MYMHYTPISGFPLSSNWQNWRENNLDTGILHLHSHGFIVLFDSAHVPLSIPHERAIGNSSLCSWENAVPSGQCSGSQLLWGSRPLKTHCQTSRWELHCLLTGSHPLPAYLGISHTLSKCCISFMYMNFWNDGKELKRYHMTNAKYFANMRSKKSFWSPKTPLRCPTYKIS